MKIKVEDIQLRVKEEQIALMFAPQLGILKKGTRVEINAYDYQISR